MTSSGAASDREFVSQAVPTLGKRAPVGIAAVFLGFIIVAGQMAVGGGLAGRLTRLDFFTAVLVGNAVSGVFAAWAGYTGAISGQTFALLTMRSFAGPSARLAQLYVPVVLIGWYAIETAIFASILGTMIHATPAVETLLAVGSAAMFATATYVGYPGLRTVGLLSVPLMLALGTYAAARASQSGSVQFGFGTSPLSLPTASAVVVGSWVMGALTCIPDLTRFLRSPALGAAIGFGGIFIGNSFNHIVGGLGAAAAHESDPARLLAALGLLVPGLVFAVANIWTTNDGNLYSASLNAGPLLGISRRSAVLVCGALGALIAVFRPQNVSVLFTFLDLLNVTAPALGGVVLGGFWAERWRWIPRPTRAVEAWIAWGSGTALSFGVGRDWSFAIGLPVGFAVFVIANRWRRRAPGGSPP